MTNAEKFTEVFGVTPKTICDADNNEWWDEPFAEEKDEETLSYPCPVCGKTTVITLKQK